MKIKLLIRLFISTFLFFPIWSISEENSDNSNQQISVTKLSYIEREPNVDNYGVTMFVSDRYIRIDEADETSGYIIYDDKNKIIYSVSHGDKSILVINQHVFSSKESPVKSATEYSLLGDAPKISGKNVFNYRVYVKGEKVDSDEKTCVEIQLVENFLPKVTAMLQNYQKIVSGQQVKMVDNKVTEMQSACFYVDQIYNEGKYYKKGLPIQEWHSSGRFKALTSYKQTLVASDFFSIPKNYKQFSMDMDSKRFLQ